MFERKDVAAACRKWGAMLRVPGRRGWREAAVGAGGLRVVVWRELQAAA
jgi:hypothetical protein